VLVFSVATEAVTGIAALTVPALVGRLLLGVDVSSVESIVVRCFGIALVALSIAAWPGEAELGSLVRPVRAMVVYNALIALVLGYAGTAEGIRGPLLWPAVAIHAVVTVLLLWPRSTSPSIR
jgi:hypothetical protein